MSLRASVWSAHLLRARLLAHVVVLHEPVALVVEIMQVLLKFLE